MSKMVDRFGGHIVHVLVELIAYFFINFIYPSTSTGRGAASASPSTGRGPSTAPAARASGRRRRLERHDLISDAHRNHDQYRLFEMFFFLVCFLYNFLELGNHRTMTVAARVYTVSILCSSSVNIGLKLY